MDFIRQLWKIRCGYISAESVLTAEQILRQRTRQIHDRNAHMKEKIVVIDRHLLEKKESYFYSSSIDTLEIWERKVKDVLKNIDNIPHSQPTIAATINTMRRDYIIREVEDEHAETGNKRRAQFCSNMNPIWHKRLKLSFGFKRTRTKMKAQRKNTVRQRFRRLQKKIRRQVGSRRNISRTGLRVQFNNIISGVSINSEWS